MQSLNPVLPGLLVFILEPHDKQDIRPKYGWNVPIWQAMHGFKPDAEKVPWSHNSMDKLN